MDEPALPAFAGSHGYNLTSTGIDWGWECEEAVLESEPFRGRLDVTIDGDTLSLEIDDELNVIRVDTVP